MIARFMFFYKPGVIERSVSTPQQVHSVPRMVLVLPCRKKERKNEKKYMSEKKKKIVREKKEKERK